MPTLGFRNQAFKKKQDLLFSNDISKKTLPTGISWSPHFTNLHFLPLHKQLISSALVRCVCCHFDWITGISYKKRVATWNNDINLFEQTLLVQIWIIKPMKKNSWAEDPSNLVNLCDLGFPWRAFLEYLSRQGFEFWVIGAAND